MTAKQMFDRAAKNITGIRFFFTSSDDVKKNVAKFGLEERYSKVKKFAGTRSHFLPVSELELHMRRLSADVFYCAVFLGEEIVLETDSDRY